MEAKHAKENVIYRDKVFFTLIEEMSRGLVQEKFFVNIIKGYIKRYILVYDKEKSGSSKEISLSKQLMNKNDYENFLNHLKELNIICKSNNESNFMTDLIVYIVKTLYDGVYPVNINYYDDETTTSITNQAISYNQISPNLNNMGIF